MTCVLSRMPNISQQQWRQQRHDRWTAREFPISGSQENHPILGAVLDEIKYLIVKDYKRNQVALPMEECSRCSTDRGHTLFWHGGPVILHNGIRIVFLYVQAPDVVYIANQSTISSDRACKLTSAHWSPYPRYKPPCPVRPAPPEVETPDVCSY
ncbi:hypothetical protein ElyMa_006790500 [Elysia marginata]|uniref:Uncharacterized protein n=1 Tax=Elysia marginata TaxID=1093978 RepID=A0AAV4J0B4_9GAST|nr:hypothetical protein ElyMa_006790500 [Elysia marginata]